MPYSQSPSEQNLNDCTVSTFVWSLEVMAITQQKPVIIIFCRVPVETFSTLLFEKNFWLEGLSNETDKCKPAYDAKLINQAIDK